MSAAARPLTAVATAVLVLVAVTACGTTPAGSGGSSTTGSPSSAPPTSTPGTPSPSPSGGGAGLPADLLEREQVQAAVEDAATRQGVGPDQVAVATFSPVTWNDGSLGCPQEGMAYTSATVEGELLVLRVGQSLLQYHGRVGGPYLYCADPSDGYAVG